MTTDLDARAYFPKYDVNDNLCALIKVTLTSPLQAPLVLEVGGLGVVAREVQESGEVWFYVPSRVKNLTFKCSGYTSPAPIPVIFKEGCVYRITINPDAVVETIANALVSTNYFKLELNEPGAIISLGKTREYELFTKNIDGQEFATLLDYGTYYYRIEHPLRKLYEGVVVLDASSTKQNIELSPAYGYLDINSTPAGAMVYVNNKKIGKTPCNIIERIPEGSVEVRFVMDDYYSSSLSVDIVGDGSRQTISQNLKPQFANISFTCTNNNAEIWIDNQFKGKGMWSGRLNSMSKHYVETRLKGHVSQSINVTVKDGEDATYTLAEPIPIYGTLNLTTNPLDCTIILDGEEIGETPYISNLLVGEHTITLAKDGYLRTTFSVNIEKNKRLDIDKTLEKGRLKSQVTVSCFDKSAELYANDKYLGTGSWEGTLDEGKYRFEARKAGFAPSVKEDEIVGSHSNLSYLLLSPRKAYGSLSVESKNGAIVELYSCADKTKTSYAIHQLEDGCKLLVGDYTAYAHKKDHNNSPVYKFTIKENEHTAISLPLTHMYPPMQRLKRWAFNYNTHPYYSDHFAEITWGDMGWGVNYGWFPGNNGGGHLGVHGSLATEFGGVGFAVGPLFRLGLLGSVESHIYTGVGYNSNLKQPKYEAGLRFAYDLAETNLNLSSISVGAVYLNETLFPKVGVSLLLPAAIFIQEKDTNVAWHIDGLFGFGQECNCCGDYISETLYGNFSDMYFMGLHCAYTPNKLGWYVNALWAIEGNVSTYTTGPTLSLYRNNLYLYGGVGMVDRSFGYDLGLGITLDYIYDLSLGIQWNDRHSIVTFGFGLPFGGDDNGLGW